MIYVFVCQNGPCLKSRFGKADPPCLVLIRQQLPEENQFYSQAEEEEKEEKEEEEEEEEDDEDHALLMNKGGPVHPLPFSLPHSLLSQVPNALSSDWSTWPLLLCQMPQGRLCWEGGSGLRLEAEAQG